VTVAFENLDPDDLREALTQTIRSISHSITHYSVQLEIEREALEEFDGEEHDHRHENLLAIESAVRFDQRKIEIAKRMLADLD